jgi:adenosine deaminase
VSALYRNASGTKSLAQQYGLSKEEVKNILEKYLVEKRKAGDIKPLEPCYDHSTRKYFSFEEWMDHLLKNWDKLPSS